MLAKLFNSQAKVKLIAYFLSNNGTVITIARAAKKVKISQATARSACRNLAALGVIKKETSREVRGKGMQQRQKRGYTINTEFILYPEIRALFLKSQVLFEGDLVTKIKKLGGAVFIVLTGVFTDTAEECMTDILIVGKINREKLARIVATFERKLGFPINYTVMSRTEYAYRRDITDRFLYTILEKKHMIILDKIHGR